MSCKTDHRRSPVTRLLLGAVLVASITPIAASCGERSNERPVARVGDWTLGAQRLADLLVLAQPLPLDSATVDAIVEQWIAAAAIAQRAAAGDDLTGEAAMNASLWLERREAVLEADRRLHLEAATRVSAARAKAEFDADTLRLLAHVLRRTGAFTSPAERDLQRRTAQGVLDGLLRGGRWSDAVKQSEDATNRSNSGLLGLLRIDELPPALRDAASRLLPGQVSSVIESPDGYHVLYRPRWQDVSDLYTRLLSDRLLTQADSQATRRMEDSLHVHVEQAAAAGIRAMARGGRTPDSASALARWNGGELQADVAGRYVAALPDEDRMRLAASTDAEARRFIEQLATREARLEVAITRGVQADSATRSGLERMHRDDVDEWTAALSDGAPAFSKQALDRYMERLMSRQIAFEPVAPLFRQWLLEPLDVVHDRTAQNEAITIARRLLDASRNQEQGDER